MKFKSNQTELNNAMNTYFFEIIEINKLKNETNKNMKRDNSQNSKFEHDNSKNENEHDKFEK